MNDRETLDLLKEALYFMNRIPNNKYYTMAGNKNHYELCSRITKYLNKNKDELPTM